MRPGGTEMGSGKSIGDCSGDYCLDECNGLEAELPGIDGFKY